MNAAPHPRTALATLATGVVALTVVACGSSGGTSSAPAPGATTGDASARSASELAPVSGPYAPDIRPADFTTKVDNPLFPLSPGSTTRATGVAENGTTAQLDVATVTNRTKRVDGVDCVVVRDVVSQHGAPVEKTFDWYAQDRAGNVWYFGEDSNDYRGGHFVPSGGSFQAGTNGAEPGIIMPADPQPGDAYRQEYYSGHALDQAKVIGASPAPTPYRDFKRTLTTIETSALEPGVREEKHYAPGLGEVASHDISGDREAFRLVSVKSP